VATQCSEGQGQIDKRRVARRNTDCRSGGQRCPQQSETGSERFYHRDPISVHHEKTSVRSEGSERPPQAPRMPDRPHDDRSCQIRNESEEQCNYQGDGNGHQEEEVCQRLTGTGKLGRLPRRPGHEGLGEVVPGAAHAHFHDVAGPVAAPSGESQRLVDGPHPAVVPFELVGVDVGEPP
jgi:hypothetical protein